MLVITRKVGDRLQIGDDITVTLLEITGSSVRLGIDAPAEIAVYRHEILKAVQEENRAAAEASAELPPSPSTSPETTSS
jgi:carbon storage regulator